MTTYQYDALDRQTFVGFGTTGTRLKLMAMMIAIAAFGSWFQKWSLDGLQGAVLTVVLHPQDTAYADGYTDRGFRAIQTGMNDEEVRALLGGPLGVTWSYRTTQLRSCVLIRFKGDKIHSSVYSDDCEKRGLRKGLPASDAAALLGHPDDVYWIYSESPSDTHFRQRVIRFSDARVVEITTGWYLD